MATQEDFDLERQVMSRIEIVQNLAPDVHLFCPRLESQRSSDVEVKQEDSNVPTLRAISHASDLGSRLEAFCECFKIFSFEGDDAIIPQDLIRHQIARNLARCHACVLGYYTTKHRWLEGLRQDFSEDEIANTIKLIEDNDINRISQRLDSVAGACLRDPDHSAASTARPCLLDALSSESFLSDPLRLREHFQLLFNHYRNTPVLRFEYCLPGTTIFLFDPDPAKRQWASTIWSATSTTLTQDEFNFAVKRPLAQVLNQWTAVPEDKSVVETLWKGISLMLERFDKNLVTHSLRAMEVQKDIFMLSLEHSTYDSTGLRHVLRTLRMLLNISPRDFWESMGTISAQLVIENIFNNRRYVQCLRASPSVDRVDVLADLLDWIRPFIASLETVRQSQSCRTLTSFLLDHWQSEDLPDDAKIACFASGLKAIKLTALNCNKERPTLSPIGRVVAAELLEVFSQYVQRILALQKSSKAGLWQEHCSKLSFEVVELALTLECKCLRTDQDALRDQTDSGLGTCSYATATWDHIVRHLDQQNTELAKAALTGIHGLTGLEKFETRGEVIHKKHKNDFNIRLGHFTHLTCQMLERMNDFDPRDLDELFHDPTTATALVASLFSPDASTYEAGVNLMKSISLESSRKEAIRHILTPYFEVTLKSLSRSLRRIALARSYASCPRMLKTCGDVLDILCDSQNGLLRTRSLQGSAEIRALEDFWEHQWSILTVIYEMTETWSRAQSGDPEVMKEFVRDTMDLSERIFDQYSVLASAVNSALLIKDGNSPQDPQMEPTARKLLGPPAKTMEVIVKWLRLRDLYLVGMSVKLTIKVLGRLTVNDLKLADGPSDFIENVVKGGAQGRTNLSPQEKAELVRALEANLGRSIDPEASEAERLAKQQDRDAPLQKFMKVKKEPKNGVIDLDSWRSKSKSASKVIEVLSEDEFPDSQGFDADILALSRSVELSKSRGIAVPSKRLGDRQGVSKTNFSPNTRALEAKKAEERRLANGKAFSEKRKKEKEEKRRRDAEQAAMLRKRSGKAIDSDTRLGKLGVQGKEHAPKGAGVMVGTDSESDSEDEIDQALFGGATKVPTVSNAVKEYENSRLKQLKEQGPIKKRRKARSAKDMRARLAPDLTALHNIILRWEFFHNREFPPGSERDDYSLVSASFRTASDYQNTFEPLLLLEAWQGFLKSKEEGSYKPFDIKIANRLTVDSFVEVSTTISLQEGKDLGINEADVVLISKAPSPATEPNQPHCLARVFKINRKKASMEISYRVSLGNSLLGTMVPNATFFGIKILSLTPLEREYGALLGLKYFDLCDEIIKAQPSPILEYSRKQLSPLELNYKVNTAQAKAVKSALDNDAFTLIQGPPGSGKTKTIVAIVGALLSGQFGDKGTPIARPQNDASSLRNGVEAAASKKMLICAPSNAAVDELIMRFKDGVRSLNGKLHKPSILRLGRSDAINKNVLDVTLDELVNARLNDIKPKQNAGAEDVHQIMMAHKATCDELNMVRANFDAVKADGKPISPEQQREFELLKRKRDQLSNKIDATRDSGDMVAREAEINRRQVQQAIIESAHVICATLSGSGHEMFQNLNIEFETVIIDEAAQSIELSALIPLKYGCTKCILVGDPKQLPPTVLSREAARFQYEQSLFVRMQNRYDNDVHLLDTQYRMHPEISKFPCREFYDGRLLDGEGMARLRARPWHESTILGPYRFFDVQGVQQTASRGHSLVNIAEVEMALRLFGRLISDGAGYDFKGKVGIITPYKSQLKELRARFSEKYSESIFSTVEFNTTDAFQGRESEIIIFSCVRASTTKGIGFLSDIRRMNVGITRAKCSLWVLGNSQSLVQGEIWNRLIQDARHRGHFSGAEVMERLQKPLYKFDAKAVAQSERSSVQSAATLDGDIEMGDAPATNSSRDISISSECIASSRATSELANNNVPREQGFPESTRLSVDQSTSPIKFLHGSLGLNPQNYCMICGSDMHLTRACDNVEGLNMSTMKCYRCGSVDHRKDNCNAERCLECGDFGHLAHVCTNPRPLSMSEKERVRRLELSRKTTTQQSQEKQRKKQLGEHAKETPVVRATRITPPPTGGKPGSKHSLPPKPPVPISSEPSSITTRENPGKRRRQSSPLNTPKAPKLSKSQRRKERTGNSGDMTTGLAHPLPLRSPNYGSSNNDLQGQSANNRLPPRLEPVTQQRPESVPTLAETSRPARSSAGESIIERADANILPPSLHEKKVFNKPPKMKKRDTNPLLIPNRKPRK